MVTRPKLLIEINKPLQIELLYNECVSGKNQFGSFYLYAVKSDGHEFSYFAPEPVHEELKNLKTGDCAIITKLAGKRGNKLVVKYVVECTPKEIKLLTTDAIKYESILTQPEESVDDVSDNDGLYDIMLTSYQDAIRIQKEVGIVDISNAIRLCISLFIARSK